MNIIDVLNYLIILEDQPNVKRSPFNQHNVPKKNPIHRSYSVTTMVPFKQSTLHNSTNKGQKQKGKLCSYYRILNNNTLELRVEQSNGKITLHGYKFNRIYENKTLENNEYTKVIKKLIKEPNQSIKIVLLTYNGSMIGFLKSVGEAILSKNCAIKFRADCKGSPRIQREIGFLSQLKHCLKECQKVATTKISIEYHSQKVIILPVLNTNEEILKKVSEVGKQNPKDSRYEVTLVTSITIEKNNIAQIKQYLKQVVDSKQRIIQYGARIKSGTSQQFTHRWSTKQGENFHIQSSQTLTEKKIHWPHKEDSKQYLRHDVKDFNEKSSSSSEEGQMSPQQVYRQNIYLKLKIKKMEQNFEKQANQYIELMKTEVRTTHNELQKANQEKKDLLTDNSELNNRIDELHRIINSLESDSQVHNQKLKYYEKQHNQTNERYRERARELVKEVADYKAKYEEINEKYCQLQVQYNESEKSRKLSEAALLKIRKFKH